jgi:hypothetical protein
MSTYAVRSIHGHSHPLTFHRCCPYPHTHPHLHPLSFASRIFVFALISIAMTMMCSSSAFFTPCMSNHVATSTACSLTWFSCYLESEISICTLVHALLSIYRLIAISGLKAMMCYSLQYRKFRPAVKALSAPSSLSSYSSRNVHAILSIPRACASAKRGAFVMAMRSSSVNETSQFSRHNVRLLRHGNVLRVAVGKRLKAWYGVE